MRSSLVERLLDRWLPQGSARRFVTVLAGGTAIGQALVVLSTPIISRAYGQEDMGRFGLFLSFLSLSSIAATARYELAIPGAGSDSDAEELLLISMILSVPISLLSIVALGWAITHDVLGYGSLPLWTVATLPPAIILFGAFSALRYWYVRVRRFDELGGVLIAQGCGRALTPVMVAPLHWGAGGLIAGELAGRFVGVGTMLRGAAPILRRRREHHTLTATMRRYWKFPAVMLPSGLLDVLAISLPVPLIATRFDASTAGLFLLVQRLTTLPAGLVGMGIGDVFHLGIAETMALGGGDARLQLDQMALRILKGGVLLLGPAALAAPFALPFVLGPGWTGAGRLFAIIAPWSLASLVVVPLSRLLLVVDRKEYKFVYDIVALSGLVGGMVIGAREHWSFERTMLLVSGSQCIAYLVYFWLLRRSCEPRST